MRDNADSDSRIAHARDLGIYSTHVAIIQATRRLVENHRAGTRKQAGSDGKPLALPARKGERVPVGKTFESKRSLYCCNPVLIT